MGRGRGTIIAKIGETEIKNGNEVEKGKTVTFTATAHTDYMVDTWMITPKAALQEGSIRYKRR